MFTFEYYHCFYGLFNNKEELIAELYKNGWRTIANFENVFAKNGSFGTVVSYDGLSITYNISTIELV